MYILILLFLDEKKQMVSNVEKQLEEARELVSYKVLLLLYGQSYKTNENVLPY